MFKVFGSETLLSEDMNAIMRQTIIRVADAAELDALPPLDVGTVAYVEADDTYYRRTVTTWDVWIRPDTGWIPVAAPDGYAGSSSEVRVKNGIVTVNLNLTAAANRPAGTIVDAVPGSADRAYAGNASLNFLVISSGISYRARVFGSGSINIYALPALSTGSTIYGTVSYPVD